MRLPGLTKLPEDDLRARVRGRFPEAEELPPRPALDALLEQAGADREWRTPPNGEAGLLFAHGLRHRHRHIDLAALPHPRGPSGGVCHVILRQGGGVSTAALRSFHDL